MCRILGYHGTGVDLHTLLYASPHSLEQQATDAPLQFDGRGGTNLDGWGVGWWARVGDAPERYRSATPMGDDDGLRHRAAAIRAEVAIAAVRNASPGAALDVTGSSPFVAGRWLFTHNGFVDGFRDGLGDELTAEVSPRRRAGIEGDADSETVFALLLDRLDAGQPPDEALTALLVDLAARAPGSRLNLLLGDGRSLWATRWGNSLFVHPSWHGGRVVASEPFDEDDPGWEEVPDGWSVTVTATGIARSEVPGLGPSPSRRAGTASAAGPTAATPESAP